jgi:hypothetical protein
VQRERLVWVGTASTKLDFTRPLPLVIYPAPAFTRAAMLDALDRAGLAYRSACALAATVLPGGSAGLAAP